MPAATHIKARPSRGMNRHEKLLHPDFPEGGAPWQEHAPGENLFVLPIVSIQSTVHGEDLLRLSCRRFPLVVLAGCHGILKVEGVLCDVAFPWVFGRGSVVNGAEGVDILGFPAQGFDEVLLGFGTIGVKLVQAVKVVVEDVAPFQF